MKRFMKLSFAAAFLSFLAVSVRGQEKWSRQIDQTAEDRQGEALDWIPLAQPLQGEDVGKERAGRILSYSPAFTQKSNPLSSSHQSQQFDFPFQFQRFGNIPQAQPLRQSPVKSQEPTSQSFFNFEMPYRGNDARNSLPSVQTGYQIQHSFGGPGAATSSVFNSPLFNQQPVFPPEFHPLPPKSLQQQQRYQTKPLAQQNFIDDIFPLKTKETKPLSTQQSLQNVAPQVFPVENDSDNIFEFNKPATFQLPNIGAPAAPPQSATTAATNLDSNNQQEVQLLYVPYDTLYNQQQHQQQQPGLTSLNQNSQYEVNKFNLNAGLPAVNPYQVNQFYNQDPQPTYYTTSTTNRPYTTTTLATSLKPHIFHNFASQLTTPKPKPKAHQPPLAMFLLRSSARTSQADVVSLLRSAQTIAVIDVPTKNTPDIFVGPAGMPIPNGYVKFDLPYLSQLAHRSDLNDIPFFVAPLSYRTPNGFNKILLPEPHVGSIVVNRAKRIEQQPSQPNEIFSNFDITTHKPRTTTQRQKQLQQVHNYFNDPFEVTTQRATLSPTRGNKFSYYFANEALQEVTSPKAPSKPKKKRPQTVLIEEDPSLRPALNNLYAQFNQIPNEDFYKVQANTKPATTSTSTTSTSTTTSSTTSTTPTPLFTFNTSPQIQFHSTSGQLYPEFTKAPVEPEPVPRFTTRPPPTTTTDEELRMKQYYRQQDAFRSRPHLVQPTNAPYEQPQYSPTPTDYQRPQRPTNPTKQRKPLFTPAEEGTLDSPRDKEVPINHRPAYNQQNEISDTNIEYEPNPYQLPSELPDLAPNLPGLVNNLQEKDKQNAIEQSVPTTQPPSETEPPSRVPSRRPLNRIRKPVVTKVSSSVSYSESESSTRRPANRIRRPYGSRGTYNTPVQSNDLESDSSTTTRRPSSVRNPLLRNPNRIRYQPTTEERQSLRIKPKKHYGGSKKNEAEDLDYQRDVLKQNYPVIKPGRKTTSPTAIPSSYSHITTTETPASESQQVYTVTPSNHIDDQSFPASFLEHMNIAQQYNDYNKENYGPGYFPNQEDLNPTEPVFRNEIYTTPEPPNPTTTIPTTTTTTTPAPTTTTEEPQTTATTRRSPFIRRNYPRGRTTTTTEAPQTTTPSNEERPSIRSRAPPRKVIKVRTRTRRPLHPASTVSPAEDETQPEPERKSNYRKLNRFNQDLTDNDQVQRRRYKQPYQLEGQESQWTAPKVADGTNFKPVNPKENRGLNRHRFEDEPEIVTAAPESPEKQEETYEINVGANYGSSGSKSSPLEQANLKPEKSFAELLEEVMGKAPQETTTEAPKTTDGTFFESQKTTIFQRLKERRGKWKKQQNRQESFETAESQSLGTQLANSLYNQEKESDTGRALKSSLISTTPMSRLVATTTTTAPFTTTFLPSSSYEFTTPQQEMTTESVTLPMDLELTSTENPFSTTTMNSMDLVTKSIDNSDNEGPFDDLESQPSLFSEVKRQLHELFAIEENEEQAVTAALAAVGRRRQQYTDIKRTKPETSTPPLASGDLAGTTESSVKDKNQFHKNLMEHVVYATSQPVKEVTPEAEICYRGRCIRSEDLPPNHKLH